MKSMHPWSPFKKINNRLCVDLTKLNDTVRREKLILPAVDQTLAMLSGAAVFSKLDCYSGLFQIPLTSNCTHLTTFITLVGRFCFKRLPFGVTSASEVYQKKDVCDIGQARRSSMFNRTRTRVRQGPIGT